MTTPTPSATPTRRAASAGKGLPNPPKRLCLRAQITPAIPAILQAVRAKLKG